MYKLKRISSITSLPREGYYQIYKAVQTENSRKVDMLFLQICRNCQKEHRIYSLLEDSPHNAVFFCNIKCAPGTCSIKGCYSIDCMGYLEEVS